MEHVWKSEYGNCDRVVRVLQSCISFRVWGKAFGFNSTYFRETNTRGRSSDYKYSAIFFRSFVLIFPLRRQNVSLSRENISFVRILKSLRAVFIWIETSLLMTCSVALIRRIYRKNCIFVISTPLYLKDCLLSSTAKTLPKHWNFFPTFWERKIVIFEYLINLIIKPINKTIARS